MFSPVQTLKKLKQTAAIVTVVTSVLVAPLQMAATASAAAVNTAPQTKVSFTFDDGLATAYTQAAPTLAKYGLAGTDYVATGCVGGGKPCKEKDSYMTWDQIVALQNQYGWEIASHTVSHPQLTTLTNAKMIQELTDSKTTLASHGINATDFATPYGDYNPTVLAEIAKLYATHRAFRDQGQNKWPYNEYLINDYQVQAGVPVATVKARIDQAIANNEYLVLTFHNIKPVANPDPNYYEYSTADLDQIAAYVKAKQDAGLLKSTTVNKSMVTGDTNLLTNGGFANGLSGWLTDAPANIKADANNHGAYPESKNSVAITAGATNEHFYSPKVSVNSANTYMIKSFLNVTARTSGELGYYIDEYDANGNWISGQYRRSENSVWAENMNFSYTPSSDKVAQASLQIYVTAGSGIKAYVDQAQWFALTNNVVVPPPAPTNLMVNGDFAQGISGGWTTNDPVNIVADHAGNGSANNPQDSVKMTASTIDRHLFSGMVAVDPTKSYSLVSFLNLLQINSGEVGFYIDEYDANGNWISGQWKSSVNTVGTRQVSFQYTPSSANVAKASLQVYVTGNSGILAYFDDVRWIQN